MITYTRARTHTHTHNQLLHQYADDIQVYISTSAGNTEAAVSRLAACLADSEPSRLRLNPTKTRWCGWVRCNSWPRCVSQKFRWRCHVSTSRRRHVTLASSSTVSWRCLHKYPPYVAVATTSYERSSDPCRSSDAVKMLVQAFISCRLD